MSDITVRESEEDKNALVLTISKESFGEFIRDLISEQRRIRRDIKASYTLGRPDLLDLIALINQRVNLQNQIVLSTFSIGVAYRDGYRQGFESLEAFNASRDARQSEVCGVLFLLTYVVKFPNREKPEKQEVSVFIRNIRAFEQSVTSRESFSWLPVFEFADETGAAQIVLEYTDISWGYDLENLVSQYLLAKMSRSKLAGRRLSCLFVVVFVTVLAFMSLVAGNYEKYDLQNKIIFLDSIDRNANLQSIDKINKKVDLLIAQKTPPLNGNQAKSLLIRTLGIGLAGIAASLMILIRRQSYLLLNEFTEQLYRRHEKYRDYIRYAVVTSFIVGLLASLGASAIYDVIKN